MNSRFLACLLLVLTLVGTALFTFSCNNGEGETTVTDDGTTTEAPDTEAPYVDARPELSLPADAASLDALILSIDGPTVENEKAIEQAYIAYCALPTSEKNKVVGYEYLTALRYNLTKAFVVKEYSDSRIPHNELLIGAYGAGPTEEHIKQVKDCYVDYTWSASPSTYDWHQKYGLGVFAANGHVGLPYLWEGTEDDYRTAIAGVNVQDHPALWAIDCIDEPSSELFSAINVMGQVIQNEVLPECGFFANLFPNYGGNWGTSTYKQYLMAYANRIETDILCYDHYMYGFDQMDLGLSLENFDLVAEICRQKGLDHYAILQVNTLHRMIEDGIMSVSEDMMKFQAYTAMAYGCKSIAWACWSHLWWEENVLDRNNNRTEQYWELQSTNADLKALEPIYMRYSSVSNALLNGEKNPLFENLAGFSRKNKVEDLKQTSLTNIASTEEDAVLVAHFEKNVGEGEAFLFVGCEDPYFLEDTLATVTFKTAEPDADVTSYVKGIATKLTPDANGVYTVEIHNADAVFVTVD